ncbi:hypothetical protein PV396_24295 [Streptomyces sp. ME02-8801-2C]|uniref:hypothetical protein n=1 Tax=Streptomyces sp. ME02-8801-2C TaxID=3028680 RepID=UPI0029A5B977|nr:hypothetical protein [Streptomyces sp. ME02-8801-2C]MDX3455023.1 hypothetical protein [Streptomyces sp. ME02-8801-2C]
MSSTTAADAEARALGRKLLKAAASPREKAAVWALVEEGEIFARSEVRRTLVWQTDKGIELTWQHLSCGLYALGLDDSERSFVDLVLSIAWPHQTSLMRVTELGSRRLDIVLQAIRQLAGDDMTAART